MSNLLGNDLIGHTVKQVYLHNKRNEIYLELSGGNYNWFAGFQWSIPLQNLDVNKLENKRNESCIVECDLKNKVITKVTQFPYYSNSCLLTTADNEMYYISFYSKLQPHIPRNGDMSNYKGSIEKVTDEERYNSIIDFETMKSPDNDYYYIKYNLPIPNIDLTVYHEIRSQIF